MGVKVQTKRTPVSEDDLALALMQGWKEVLGNEPTKEQISVLLSQNALETNHRQAMWNYNIGNITTSGKGEYNYFTLKHKDKSENVLKYRAYNNLKDAAIDYLKFLSNNKRYASAWQHIINPNPELYAKTLKSSGYYTGNEQAYTKSLKSLFKKFNTSEAYEIAQKNQNKGTVIDYGTNEVLDVFNKLLASSKNDIKISISSNDIVDNIKFGSILCSILEEELFAKAFIHTNGKRVDVECKVFGNKDMCYNVLKEITCIAEDNFNSAIKNNNIKTNIIFNTKSSYPPITLKAEESNERKFLLKNIKG
jgi:hypothetical protein